jgi:hypothetical protein
LDGFVEKLKFPVQPGAENRDRTQIPIKCRIGDELVIHGGMDRFPELEIVIGFQGFLPAVIQPAVAAKNACAAIGKKLLVNRADGTDDTGETKGVIRPVP